MAFEKWQDIVRLRLRSFFRRSQVETELNEELQDHLERKTHEYVAAGLTSEEARRKAIREFGGVELSKENCRDARHVDLIETLIQDVRYGVRVLRKSPGFTLVAVLTLCLGIGANTTIFSLVYTVLLKTLPYPDADRLVMAYEEVRLPDYHNDRNEPTPANFFAWVNQTASFDGIAAYRNRSFNLTGSGAPVRVEGELVTADFFNVLRAKAALGRVFAAEDDRPGNSRVVVMSDSYWRGQFAADRQILDKKLLLDGEEYAVVGVMPPGFHFPDPDDHLWVPLALGPAELSNRKNHSLVVFARLKERITLQQARAEMNLLAARRAELYPDTNAGQTVTLVPLQEEISGAVKPELLILLAAVGLTLLIVCANLATLLLSRASARSSEIAVRLALGAGRSRVFCQLLTESFLLALLGCASGLLLAGWGVGVLRLLTASSLPRSDEFAVNGPVLTFSVLISILAPLVFGLAPALQAARGDVHDALKAGFRESATSSQIGMRNLLIVLETALGVVVIAGAGLLLRSFLSIENVRLGFHPEGVLSFRVIPRGERYSEFNRRARFYQQAIARIEALPGVASAAAVTFIPLTNYRGTQGFTVEGRALLAPGEVPQANYDVVTPKYFETMQIPLLEGRDFSWVDTSQSQMVVIINQAMAKTVWPREDPLGKRVRQGDAEAQNSWLTIVGIVGDVREFDPITAPQPTIYFPTTQFHDPTGILRDWVVRSNGGDSLAIASNIRGAIWAVDKDLPVTRLQTMEDVRSRSVNSQRLNLLLFGFFAALALMLATIGIYGVTAYGVTQRTREIGIRVALGAQRRDVMHLVVGSGLRLTAFGLSLGLLGALAFTHLMAGMIYGVSATDPLTFCAVTLLLALVAFLACYIPARRAMRVDPIVALRYE